MISVTISAVISAVIAHDEPFPAAQNYPWLLNLGPLVGAIAAGCPAVIKVRSSSLSTRIHPLTNIPISQPSEHSPYCSALLAKLVHEDLADPAYHVVLGDVEQSKALLSKRWGHSEYPNAL